MLDFHIVVVTNKIKCVRSFIRINCCIIIFYRRPTMKLNSNGILKKRKKRSKTGQDGGELRFVVACDKI